MAEPLNETNQTNPRNSCFLGCFGFSMNIKTQQKPIQKKTSSLSWMMLRLSSRKSSTKTVPIDNTEKAKADHRKTKTSKLTKKKPDITTPSFKPHKPSRQNSKADLRLASTNQVARETPKEARASQRSLSESGSAIKPKPKPKKTQIKLSHTVSLPVLEGSQRVDNPRIHALINSNDPQRLKNDQVVEKFEPIMGMAINMVTLIIILLWGRLCAILCTLAWLYFCPCF